MGATPPPRAFSDLERRADRVRDAVGSFQDLESINLLMDMTTEYGGKDERIEVTLIKREYRLLDAQARQGTRGIDDVQRAQKRLMEQVLRLTDALEDTPRRVL